MYHQAVECAVDIHPMQKEVPLFPYYASVPRMYILYRYASLVLSQCFRTRPFRLRPPLYLLQIMFSPWLFLTLYWLGYIYYCQNWTDSSYNNNNNNKVSCCLFWHSCAFLSINNITVNKTDFSWNMCVLLYLSWSFLLFLFKIAKLKKTVARKNTL